MNPGEVIKQKRIEKRMTIRGLAEAVGVSPAAIHRYESGKVKNVPIKKMEKLAEVLDMVPSDLFGFGVQMQTPNVEMNNKTESIRSMIEEFTKLMELVNQGVLTQEEFQTIKAKLIDSF